MSISIKYDMRAQPHNKNFALSIRDIISVRRSGTEAKADGEDSSILRAGIKKNDPAL
jgi:hypothetical protein